MVADAGHARLLALVLHRRRADLHGRDRRVAVRRAGDRRSARSRCATAPAAGPLIVGAGRTGPQPDARAARDRRRARGRLRRRQPAAAPPPRSTASRCSARSTSCRAARAHRARHRPRHDPERAARPPRRGRRRVRRGGRRRAASSGARSTSTRASSSAPRPSERHLGRRPRRAGRDAARARTLRSTACSPRSRSSGSRSRVLTFYVRRGVAAEDAVGLHRRARVDADLALDRGDGPRGAARRADLLQVALRLRDRAVLVDPLDRRRAYAAIKYVNAVVMTLAAVPTYLLARMLVAEARVAIVVARARGLHPRHGVRDHDRPRGPRATRGTRSARG